MLVWLLVLPLLWPLVVTAVVVDMVEAVNESTGAKGMCGRMPSSIPRWIKLKWWAIGEQKSWDMVYKSGFWACSELLWLDGEVDEEDPGVVLLLLAVVVVIMLVVRYGDGDVMDNCNDWDEEGESGINGMIC